MLPEKKAYRSYLVRCWLPWEMGPNGPLTGRFIVESISDKPHQWGFNSFEEMTAFLRAEFLSQPPSERRSVE